MNDKHISAQAISGQGLRIVQRAERQFSIESTNADPDNWEATYVHMQGFFGAHGPHVFAAAPDMLEALRGLLRFAENTESELGIVLGSANIARAAIAKAEGR